MIPGESLRGASSSTICVNISVIFFSRLALTLSAALMCTLSTQVV